ncbi:MAG: hypothetical protein IPK08_06605 [Bacteroidetes bacterium]|nr:hypothetical protein [Bacteroidota bacterium]
MKNSLLFIVILFTIAANGFSQTSFRIELDTSSGATGPDVASTLDGHIAVSYANQDDDLILMKLDTLGNVFWTKNFGVDGFNGYGYQNSELTAAMDNYW